MSGRPGAEIAACTGRSAALTFEIAALDAARSAGVSVPRTYAEVVIEGRSGLVMDRPRGG
jgi:hypothetical protein